MNNGALRQTTNPVLVVDDDSAQLKTLADILAMENLEAICCQTGQEALHICRQREINVGILDLRLPDINGLDLLKQLKVQNPDIKLIINTGYASLESAMAALNEEAFAYVRKMGDIEELLVHVHRAFHTHLASYSEILEKDVEKRTEALLKANKELKNEIAERKRVEAALRESEQAFQTLLKSITDYVWSADVIDDQVIYLYYSPVVEQITGYPPEYFMRSVDAWLSIIHPQDKAQAKVILEQEFRGELVTHEYRIIRPDGQVKWLYGTTSPTLDRAGRVIRLDGVVSDITERKQLEEQLRQSQKMEAIGRLAGGVAHDFNNVLTVITGYSELLLQRRLGSGDTPRREVEEIKKASKRAASLTSQLLAFSRKQMFQLQVLDLNAVISNMETMLRRLIGEDIALNTVLDPRLERIRADPSQIEQVIMNLAVNARDAMPQGGKLTIETMNFDLDSLHVRRHVDLEPGPYVKLLVRDTGSGMDRETLSHIFEPFFTTKEQGKGTGLGLATVYGIITQSGGYIEAYSELGQGTMIEICLPRIEGPAEAAKSDKPGHRPRGSETILLVEDEESVRELARHILGLDGYTVLEASNGKSALQISEQHPDPIHLLLTDVVMPGGLSGRGLVERLTPLRPEIKVLYVSGYSNDTIIDNVILSPGTAFLQKPFTLADLTGKVRELLDGADQNSKPRLNPL